MMVKVEVVDGVARAAAFEIRRQVFQEEQGIPASEDRDGNDDAAMHWVAVLDGTPVATVRIRLVRGFGENYVKVERLAVLKSSRHMGIGQLLMNTVRDWAAAAAHRPTDIRLNSQTDSADFYRELGYHDMGEPFVEVEILHVPMRLELR